MLLIVCVCVFLSFFPNKMWDGLVWEKENFGIEGDELKKCREYWILVKIEIELARKKKMTKSLSLIMVGRLISIFYYSILFYFILFWLMIDWNLNYYEYIGTICCVRKKKFSFKIDMLFSYLYPVRGWLV